MMSYFIRHAFKTKTINLYKTNFFVNHIKMNSRNMTSGSQREVIFESHLPDITEPNMLLHHFIWSYNSKWSNLIAIECAVSGKKYKYGELYTNSTKFGSSLKRLGFVPGDSIGIYLPNIPEYPIVYFGSLKNGMLINTINSNFNPDELQFQLKDTKTKCLVCHPSNLKSALKAKESLKQDIKIICTHDLDGTPPTIDDAIILFEDIIASNIDVSNLNELVANPYDTVLITYSSGTTGLPKGVCLTHKSITANLLQFAHGSLCKFETPQGDVQDVMPAFLPFFHSYGNIGILLAALKNGAKIVSFPKFDVANFFRVLATSKKIFLNLVPSVISLMIKSPQVTAKHLQSIREILTAAAPIGKTDLEQIRSKTKAPISQAYGMTEASPLVTINSTADCIQNNISVGKLLPNTKCKILDIENGNCLTTNALGHMVFKGPQVMKCYLNNPEATSKAIDTDGWLQSGDVGMCDENGFFYVEDRLKEMIKVSGYQVAPAELEEVLRSHPKIADAGVIGILNQKCGEKPVAFVQLVSGTNAAAQDIIEFVAKKVTKYKQISSVKFIDRIPKTPSGKILRKDLKYLL